MAKDPFQYFRIEAQELIDQLSDGILKLETTASPGEVVGRLLRAAHTIKGAARVVKQPKIANQAHLIEEILGPFRNAERAPSTEQINLLLSYVDEMRTQLSFLGKKEEVAPEKAALPSAPVEVIQTVRAEVAEMDRLLENVAEAHSQVALLQTTNFLAVRSKSLAELLRHNLNSPNEERGTKALEERTRATAEELHSALGKVNRDWGNGIEQLSRELNQIREGAERLRLVQAGTIFTFLDRVVRDVAQAQNKKVQFKSSGGEIRLDAHVLEGVQSALVQTARNAVAHGIEDPAARVAAGKQPEGNVSIEIVLRDRHVAFICRDDGSGIDLTSVQKALKNQGINAGVDSEFEREQLITLLLKSGISTSSVVTEVSGRGLGLDIVRNAVEQLGGEVFLKTKVNQGTTVELVVPLFVAALDALITETGGVQSSIPLAAVRACKRITPNEIIQAGDKEVLMHEGQTVPFLSLAQLLRPEILRRAKNERPTSAIIIEAAGEKAALGVDRLLGTMNIVMRPLPSLAVTTEFVAGVSLDSDGNPQIILDPNHLVSAVQQMIPIELEVEQELLPVLIIDDSLTTRMMEQSILESAGYKVELATSAEEGLEKAAQNKYLLFLVDVEMPGMDGFSFVECCKRDSHLRDTPAILVTSRCGPDDIRRGVEVGAAGHIVKGEFDQRQLLELIRSTIVGNRSTNQFTLASKADGSGLN